MVVMTTFSTEIVKVLFEEGSFNSHDTYLTSTALFFYSIGILAYGLKELLAKSFYSLQDTKTPVRNATISVVINIVFSIILVNIMGIGGLALASSISATVTTMLLLISLRKKIGKIGFSYILKTFIKGAVSYVCRSIQTRIRRTQKQAHSVMGSVPSCRIHFGHFDPVFIRLFADRHCLCDGNPMRHDKSVFGWLKRQRSQR